jgi:hypothetical protein
MQSTGVLRLEDYGVQVFRLATFVDDFSGCYVGNFLNFDFITTAIFSVDLLLT